MGTEGDALGAVDLPYAVLNTRCSVATGRCRQRIVYLSSTCIAIANSSVMPLFGRLLCIPGI